MSRKPTTKKCSQCGRRKNIVGGFWNLTSSKDGVDYRCIPCRKESKKRNPKKTKKTASRCKLKKRYHLNHEQILEVESRTHCEVCGVRFSKGRGPTYRNVDHCHIHDTYRGVICRNCNIALGLVNDDPKILQSLIEYINQHNKTLAPLHNE